MVVFVEGDVLAVEGGRCEVGVEQELDAVGFENAAFLDAAGPIVAAGDDDVHLLWYSVFLTFDISEGHCDGLPFAVLGAFKVVVAGCDELTVAACCLGVSHDGTVDILKTCAGRVIGADIAPESSLPQISDDMGVLAGSDGALELASDGIWALCVGKTAIDAFIGVLEVRGTAPCPDVTIGDKAGEGHAVSPVGHGLVCHLYGSSCAVDARGLLNQCGFQITRCDEFDTEVEATAVPTFGLRARTLAVAAAAAGLLCGAALILPCLEVAKRHKRSIVLDDGLRIRIGSRIFILLASEGQGVGVLVVGVCGDVVAFNGHRQRHVCIVVAGGDAGALTVALQLEQGFVVSTVDGDVVACHLDVLAVEGDALQLAVVQELHVINQHPVRGIALTRCAAGGQCNQRVGWACAVSDIIYKGYDDLLPVVAAGDAGAVGLGNALGRDGVAGRVLEIACGVKVTAGPGGIGA